MRSARVRAVRLLLIPLAFLIAAACGATEDGGLNTGPTVGVSGSPSGSVSAGPSTVRATLEDFDIAIDPATIDAGEVTFDIRNDGPSEHEFVVVATAPDVRAGDLPTQDGAVNEEGLEVVDEAESIASGDAAELTVDLAAGSYIVFCNIDGHYLSGMHAKLTVR